MDFEWRESLPLVLLAVVCSAGGAYGSNILASPTASFESMILVQKSQLASIRTTLGKLETKQDIIAETLGKMPSRELTDRILVLEKQVEDLIRWTVD